MSKKRTIGSILQCLCVDAIEVLRQRADHLSHSILVATEEDLHKWIAGRCLQGLEQLVDLIRVCGNEHWREADLDQTVQLVSNGDRQVEQRSVDVTGGQSELNRRKPRKGDDGSICRVTRPTCKRGEATVDPARRSRS